MVPTDSPSLESVSAAESSRPSAIPKSRDVSKQRPSSPKRMLLDQATSTQDFIASESIFPDLESDEGLQLCVNRIMNDPTFPDYVKRVETVLEKYFGISK
jgi:hypothetical protein